MSIRYKVLATSRLKSNSGELRGILRAIGETLRDLVATGFDYFDNPLTTQEVLDCLRAHPNQEMELIVYFGDSWSRPSTPVYVTYNDQDQRYHISCSEHLKISFDQKMSTRNLKAFLNKYPAYSISEPTYERDKESYSSQKVTGQRGIFGRPFLNPLFLLYAFATVAEASSSAPQAFRFTDYNRDRLPDTVGQGKQHVGYRVEDAEGRTFVYSALRKDVPKAIAGDAALEALSGKQLKERLLRKFKDPEKIHVILPVDGDVVIRGLEGGCEDAYVNGVHVTPYAEFTGLRAREILTSGKMSSQQARKIGLGLAEQVLEGLYQLREVGYGMFDLHEGNLLIQEGVLKIGDIGSMVSDTLDGKPTAFLIELDPQTAAHYGLKSHKLTKENLPDYVNHMAKRRVLSFLGAEFEKMQNRANPKDVEKLVTFYQKFMDSRFDPIKNRKWVIEQMGAFLNAKPASSSKIHAELTKASA